ncbi:MAG: histidinol dehydrogenase, partial [Planctomycetota bacterium]
MKAPWRRVEAAELRRATRAALDPATQAEAARIVEDVRVGGEQALRAHAERLGDLRPGEPLVRGPAELIAARDGLPAADRALLERTAARIEAFARAQRQCLAPLDVPVPGGRAGHRWLPVAAVGAYAPGGRYPLPSSALMTAIPARVAGV